MSDASFQPTTNLKRASEVVARWSEEVKRNQEEMTRLDKEMKELRKKNGDIILADLKISKPNSCERSFEGFELRDDVKKAVDMMISGYEALGRTKASITIKADFARSILQRVEYRLRRQEGFRSTCGDRL